MIITEREYREALRGLDNPNVFTRHPKAARLLRRIWYAQNHRDIKNVRIDIKDLTRAILAIVHLDDVQVVAAGAMYATLSLTGAHRGALSEAGIMWSLD